MKRRVIFLSGAVVLLWSAMCGAARLEVSTGEPVEIRIAGGGANGGDVSRKDQGHPDERQSGVRVDGG